MSAAISQLRSATREVRAERSAAVALCMASQSNRQRGSELRPAAMSLGEQDQSED